MGEQSNIPTWANNAQTMGDMPRPKGTIMHVTNMNSPRTGKPVANQFIITDGDITVFQSYNSTIATIDRENYTITLGKDWDCSVTTAKYRNLFFESEGFTDLRTKKHIEYYLDYIDGYGYVRDDYDFEYCIELA